ncbi:uncharacterized protein CcaverHIS019_0102120 [Cutaneotrichosporon cavernicola]|uniref:Cora-domain-containing protein n=1 Tax=Cutaneotrichosporon cavernicola TaxID=279322 RepID=A0AA48I0W8_9TREE|nr:uncharacterized protein CcaverHIS019_0102120 [Cutaneotrichosporon cavernicola]BEI87494.1 hypothetical protein CcaverHIS019_0102120 [Cutaneotrichosporon cavernicola]
MSPPPSSPRQIQTDPSLPAASHHRTMSSSGHGGPPSSPQALRPPVHRGSVAATSIGTSYRDDPGVQRQMQQDIDSAMSMSRARSSSVVERSPMVRGTRGGTYSSSPIEEAPFGMLSDAEEREMERAQYRRDHDSDDEEHRQYRHDEHHSDAESSHTYSSRRWRRRSDAGRQGSEGLRRVGSYSTADGIRSVFDFAAMDEFAATEREALDDIEGSVTGVAVEDMGTPPLGIDAEMRRRSDVFTRLESPARQQSGDLSGSGSSTRQDDGNGKGTFDDDIMSLPKDEEESPQPRFGRRARKHNKQSHPARRQAKLALFESFGGGDSEELQGGALKAPRPSARPHAPPQPAEPAPAKFTPYSDSPGHGRPYRFSFYSNALPVTIHARSLAELPAEGQTFEDLFKGRNSPDEVPQNTAEAPFSSGRNTPKDPSGLSLTAPIAQHWQQAAITKSMAIAGAPTPPPPHPDDDPDTTTWWLDVLSPTDEEMRVLSRVFGIHPLTTEDILLEETREKIELFRNYYLVCFRSFDQDPYSQTYLEPLNMYIIVFREGTLSFHFRATQHPQNVRRRIKHLKDYISVTSDWISYALIDDITDAFGPLIQSIEYEVDSIDELVLILKDSEQTDMLRRIGTCRKKVMGLLRLMGSKADVVKGLAKRCNENWLVAPKSDIGLYLSDIQDHLITMTSNLNHYEKILSRSHSNYLAQISIEMTDANNQINDVLSKLTALGTVLIPMNLVTGLWGMNVLVPGQAKDDGTDTLHWFFSILGGLAAFAVVGAWATYKCFVRV